MKDESKNVGLSTAGGTDTPALPAVVDRATFQAELDALRVREKAHTREGDAIAAARRRLPMVPALTTCGCVHFGHVAIFPPDRLDGQ